MIDQQNHEKYMLLQSEVENITVKEVHDSEHGNLMRNLFINKNIQKTTSTDF